MSTNAFSSGGYMHKHATVPAQSLLETSHDTFVNNQHRNGLSTQVLSLGTYAVPSKKTLDAHLRLNFQQTPQVSNHKLNENTL
eukprot:50403-Amphidinium_carterae.1